MQLPRNCCKHTALQCCSCPVSSHVSPHLPSLPLSQLPRVSCTWMSSSKHTLLTWQTLRAAQIHTCND
jgi:hypothetical protein